MVSGSVRTRDANREKNKSDLLKGVPLFLIKQQAWEAGMSRNPQVQKPAFEVRPSKNGLSWSVLHINKNNRRSHTYEFASEKAAWNWINYESKVWLKQFEGIRRL